MIIDVYQVDEEWFFRIVARNGRVVVDTANICDACGERAPGYKRKKAAVEIAEKIANGIGSMSVES